MIAQALGVTVEYLINGKKPQKTPVSIIPPQHKELLETLSKLNKYNNEVITAVAKMLLSLQTKNKTTEKS
jgi:hypothetical protein